jgi:hypothetical protein
MRIAGARWAAIGVLPALALALSVLAAPQALAATSDETRGGEEDSALAERPLLLCTAPWPPFVAAVPPLRPPGPKPDAAALGFAVPESADSDPAEDGAADASTAAADDPDAVVLPPPLPEVLEDQTAEDEAAQVESAAPVIPPLNVEVIPPDSPLSKRLGRVLVAQRLAWQRLQASAVPPAAPSDAASDPESDPSAVAATTPDETEDAEGASANPDADQLDTPETEQDEPSAAAPLIPSLDQLDMPTARALLPRGRAGGPVTEVVMAACRAAGLPCRVALVPWLRPGSQVAKGPCDGIFPVEDSSEHGDQLRFSAPLVTSRLAFFTLNTEVRTPKDMAEFIVLTQGPSDIADSARAVVEDLDRAALVLGPDMAPLIRRLNSLEPADRVALYGNYHAVLTEMEGITDAPIPGLAVIPHREQVFRVGFSRERVDRAAVAAFNDALSALVASPAYQDILGSGGLAPLD